MPRGLSTEIKTAIAAGTVRPVYLAHFDFVGYSLRTWTGEGDLSYASQTWLGNGHLQALPTVSEAASLYAESLSLALTGKPATAVDLSDPANYQGRPVEVYVGFYAADGALPATNIYKIFSGTMSQVQFDSDAASEAWTVTAESRLVDLNRVKSALSTHEEQRSRYPADIGYAHEPRARTAVALFRDQDIPGPASRRIIYGQRRVPGNIIFAGTSGSASKYLNLVIEIADHQCQSIEQVYIDDRALLSGGVVAGEFVGYVDYHAKLGAAYQTYLAALETEVGTSIWDSDSRLRGVAYIYLRLLSSESVFGTTLPTIEVEVKGKLIYDPRTSSTVYSTNAALALRDYLLAESGFGASIAELDDTAFATAADICDQSVSKADATSEPRYSASGVIDTSRTIGDNLRALVQACAGVLTYAGGRFVLLAGQYVAPASTLTEADLLGGEVVSNLNRRTWSNGAKGVYISAGNNWSEENYPNYTNAAHVVTDGEPRNLIYDLPLTTSAAAAQRIAKVAVNDTRRSRGLSLLCRLHAYELLCGDVVKLTLPRLGYVDALYRVESLRLQADGLRLGVALDLREIAATHYDWDASTEEIQLDTFTAPLDVLENWVNAKLSPPSGSPTSQSFISNFSVTVTHNQTGVTCRYTLDGSEPNESDPSVANGGTIAIVHNNEDVVLKLKNFETAGDLESDVVTYNYTAILTAPAASGVYVSGGSYNGDGIVSSQYFNLIWSAPATTDDGTPVTLETRDETGSSAERNWDSRTTWDISVRELGGIWRFEEYKDYDARTLAPGYVTNTQNKGPKNYAPPLLFQHTGGPHDGMIVCGSWVDSSQYGDDMEYRRRSRNDSLGSVYGAWSSWADCNFMHKSPWPADGHEQAGHDLYDGEVDFLSASGLRTGFPLNTSGTIWQYEVRVRGDSYGDVSDVTSIAGTET